MGLTSFQQFLYFPFGSKLLEVSLMWMFPKSVGNEASTTE